MAQEFVLTKKGKIELEEELEYLKTTRRSEISEQIKEARSFGDLSENAEYTEARNEQSRVGIGTKVRLLDIEFQEEETYTVMGPMETNAANHVISNESPVGSALMGKSVGDEVSIEAPGGAITFKILEISRA